MMAVMMSIAEMLRAQRATHDGFCTTLDANRGFRLINRLSFTVVCGFSLPSVILEVVVTHCTKPEVELWCFAEVW